MPKRIAWKFFLTWYVRGIYFRFTNRLIISTGEPITFSTTIHSPQDSSVGPHGENLESTSTSTRSSRKSINALALNLQPSKLNDINTNNTRPIIIVQDEDNGPVNCEAGHERPSSVLENADDREIRTRVMRSKSSPSTPVSAHLDLPSVSISILMQWKTAAELSCY